MASVKNQTSQDYEHLFIVDNVGRGLGWANTQIHTNRKKITGEWVYILDDDDWLTYPDFVKDFKALVSGTDYGLVICKGFIGNKSYPTEGYWNRRPLRGTLGSPNFITRKDIFLDYSYEWCRAKAGDFFFVNTAYQQTHTYWWDKYVFKAPIGNGLPECDLRVNA